MYWHPEGNYLLAKVERLKTKSTKATSFEVFRLKEKDIPIDLTEVADAEEIKSDIFWEPSGNKFSFLVSDDTSSSAYVYEVMPPKTAQAIKQLGKVDARGMNMIMWSPKGRFCVLAGSRGHSGSLIFYDFQDLVLLNRQEHYGFTSLEWDPTGRYVTSSTSLWKSAVDTGISIWSMIGEELTKQNIVGFKQFTWRPRPKTLLPLEDQERIISNLKDYYKEFEEEDAMASNKASAEVQAKRQEQWKEYKAMIKEFLSKKTAESKKRIDYIGYDPLQSDTETLVEVTIEEVIEETEKLLV